MLKERKKEMQNANYAVVIQQTHRKSARGTTGGYKWNVIRVILDCPPNPFSVSLLLYSCGENLLLILLLVQHLLIDFGSPSV